MTQQIHDMDSAIADFQSFKVLVKRRLRCLGTACDCDLLLSRQQAGSLFPKDGYAASHLHVGEVYSSGGRPKDRLRLHEVGDVAVIVNATAVKSRSRSSAR